MRQSESSAFIRSVLDNAAISSASLSLSASDKMPFRCRACIARIADILSAFARLQEPKEDIKKLELCVSASRLKGWITNGFGQGHTDRHKKRAGPCCCYVEDQALPKIGFGTHFSDLSNIFLNGAKVEFDAVLEEAGLNCSLALTAAVGLPLELDVELLILRFWKAFLTPLLDCVVVAILADDDAGDDDAGDEVDEVCLQLC